MIVLGVGHKSRQGKDEFANFLTTYLRMNSRNKRIIKCGFADIMKQVCYSLYSWAGVMEPEHYEKYPQDRQIILPHFGNKTVVDLWIDFGNHCREFDENIWTNALLRGTRADVLILKDVRFPNEVKCIREIGGKLIKITRPGFDGLPSTSDNALNDYHDWDEDLINDKDLKHLHGLAATIAEKYCISKL